MIVEEGKIVKLKIFDVAEEIDLGKAENFFKPKALEQPEFPYRRLTPKYMHYLKAPLLIKLKNEKISVSGKETEFEWQAKIFEFGVISIGIFFDFSGEQKELNDFSIALEESDELRDKAKKEAEKLLKKIKTFTINPVSSLDFMEEYTIFYIKSLNEEISGGETLKRHPQEIAQLLKFEKILLSDSAVESCLEHWMSYYPKELLVVDFNASLAIEENFPFDLFDVLEYAKIQLLELRVFDTLIDRQLEKIYKEFSGKEAFFAKKYSSSLNEISKFKFWVRETIEKVENSFKLIGDLYLVNAYKFALEEFHLNEWEKSVDSKILDLEDIYEKLNDKVLAKQNLYYEIILIVLEIVITVLILIELIKM